MEYIYCLPMNKFLGIRYVQIFIQSCSASYFERSNTYIYIDTHMLPLIDRAIITQLNL